jgi:hypothetical protein
MAKAADEPRDTSDGAFDRFLRFDAALFAVKKDELPKHGPKAKRDRKKPKPG